jgi:hypothetical protein
MGYVDNDDASNTSYNNVASGLGTGDVQSAIDALASSVSVGLKNYNVVTVVPFMSSAAVDTPVTGFSVTPVSGTYALFASVQSTAGGGGQSLDLSIGKAGTVIADSKRTIVSPSGLHISSLTTFTISQFNGSQLAQVYINPNGAANTITNRSFLLLRLGA